MDITYRTATEQDLPDILHLLLEVRGDISKLSATEFIVAVRDTGLIGCVRIKNMEGGKELGSLGVKSDYRNKGIGTELVRLVLEQDHFRPIYLLCFAYRENFYRKNGFEKVEVASLPECLRDEYARVTEILKNAPQPIIAMRVAT